MASIRKQKKIERKRRDREERKKFIQAKKQEESRRKEELKHKLQEVRNTLGFDNILKQIKQQK